MSEELKPSVAPIQATLVPVKVWIEKDMMGTVHIKRQHEGGPAFDFIQIQYNHMHTCNAHQHGLAEQIVALLNGAALTAAQPAQAAQVPEGFALVSVTDLTRWRDAFAEELGAWDIDPPLHHVKTSHDEINAALTAAQQGATND